MNITDEAKQMIEDVFQAKNAKNIRLYSSGGGCCGPGLGLTLEEPKETDEIRIINGIHVAIDPEAASAAKEVTLDRHESVQGAGLVLLGGSGCC